MKFLFPQCGYCQYPQIIFPFLLNFKLNTPYYKCHKLFPGRENTSLLLRQRFWCSWWSKKVKQHPWQNAVSIKFISVLWAAYYQKLKNIWKSLIFILAGLWPPPSAYVPSLTTGSRLSAVRTCLLLVPHVQLNVAIFSCHTQVTQAGTWSLPS